MIVDEIGYLPITRTGAMLFFQLLTRRYEHASTILTSNKGFEDWGEIFGDEVMAAALIDRLVHHCHIVNIGGNSYRLRQHAELARRLHAAPLHPPTDVPDVRSLRQRPRADPPHRVPFPIGVVFRSLLNEEHCRSRAHLPAPHRDHHRNHD